MVCLLVMGVSNLQIASLFEFRYMTVFELTGFALLAAIEHASCNGMRLRRRAPLYNHLIVAVSMTFSRGLTNMSLQYMNYPSQVIFKSLKLMVVLLGSVFIYSKRYLFDNV